MDDDGTGAEENRTTWAPKGAETNVVPLKKRERPGVCFFYDGRVSNPFFCDIGGGGMQASVGPLKKLEIETLCPGKFLLYLWFHSHFWWAAANQCVRGQACTCLGQRVKPFQLSLYLPLGPLLVSSLSVCAQQGSAGGSNSLWPSRLRPCHGHVLH